MNIGIRKISECCHEDWDNAVTRCAHSTYFHSREWAEVWHKYAGSVLQAKKIEFSDGRKVVVPCSYVRSLKGMIKKILMSPAGTYGGALYNGGITADHLKLVFREIKKSSSVVWRQNPFEPLIQEVWPSESEEDVTHAIDLRIGFENIFKRWTKGHRSAVRKAARTGCKVRRAETRAEWREYFNCYEDSLKRWGGKASSRYRWELFDAIFHCMSSHVVLWIIELDRQLISGALCFYQNNHVVYWHGAAYSKYFGLRPVNLLLYEAIKDACEAGYHWFDFNPSGGHKGVADFKKSFGCTTYASSVYCWRSVGARILQKIGRVIQ